MLKVELVSSPSEILKLYSFKRFDDGSGYRAVVDVVSGCFSCTKKELYFDDIKQFYNDLNNGYDNLSGEALLKCRYEEDQIKFIFNTKGHVVVSGVFHEYADNPQLLEFYFKTDQTYFPAFLKQIKKVIDEIHN